MIDVKSGGAAGSVLARRFRTSNATATTGATERQALYLPAVTVTAGRLYRVKTIVSAFGSAASGYAVIYLRYTTDGSVPTTASTALTYGITPMPTAGIGYFTIVEGYYAPTVNGTVRVAASYAGSSGNNASLEGSAGRPLVTLIEDAGIDPGNSGTDV